MTETTQANTPTTPSAPADAEARLRQVETELNSLERKMKRDARITLVVVVILLGLMIGYFTYGYREFSKVLQPKELVATVGGLVDGSIEPLRETMEAEIEKQAPVIAENLGNQAIAAIPNLRESLEEYLEEQANTAVEQFVGDTEGRFDTLLEQHREEISNLIDELQQNKDASDEVLAALEQAINDEIGQDIQANADELLELVNKLVYHAERLAAGESLSAGEIKMRTILMLARRIQLEAADPDFAAPGELGSPILRPSSGAPDASIEAPPADNAESGDVAGDDAGDKPEESAATDKPEQSPETPPAEEPPAEDKPEEPPAEDKPEEPSEEATEEPASEEN